MSPKLAYYGHHKCGSMWILGIVAELCGHLRMPFHVQDHAKKYPGEGEQQHEKFKDLFLVAMNSDYYYVGNFDCPAFHVIRDPRDVVVSGYFSHLHSHPSRQWPRLRYYRKYLESIDIEQGLFEEMSFSSQYLYSMFSWDYGNPHVLEKRFEDLIADPGREFAAILSHLGLLPERLSQEKLDAVLDRRSFDNLSRGRQAGEEEPTHHYRKGVAGDWKNHFSPRHIDLFKKLYNPLLLKTGYEKSEDW